MDKSNDIQKNTQQEELLNKQCRECNKDIEVSKERADKYDTFLCDKCKEKHRVEKIINKIKSIIPRKFWNLETDKLLDRYKNKLCSLFIHGKAGTGKTVFACSLAKEYIREGYQVKFISFPAFIMDLQRKFRNNPLLLGDDVYDYAKEIALYPEDIESDPAYKKEPREGILIIDDLGAVKLTEFVKQITYYIINEREMRVLPTIITSNFDLNEIDEMIDPRVSSRIAGICEVLQFKGNDRRR